VLAATAPGERRVRRLVHAETTKRSALDADHRIGQLQARGVEQRRDEAAIWVLVDGSDVRPPHAQAMEALQRVKRRDGPGPAPGDRTSNALGVGCQRRGRLDHHRFSSEAAGCLRASAETQAALAAVGQALAPRAAAVTASFAAGCDAVAVWGTVWAQGHHLVCRAQHRDRLVQPAAGQPACHRYDLAARWRPLARAETEMGVRKGKQACPTRQPVAATVSAVPLVATEQEGVRTRAGGARRARQVWPVAGRLDGAPEEPWWLLTDRPATTAAAALERFRTDRQRWRIEDAFKRGEQCLGWEAAQVRTLAAVRTLVAPGWAAAGFLYALGVTLDGAEVRLLTRRGGGAIRASRPPGKRVLTRGRRRLLDHRATAALPAAARQQPGQLPPRGAALLGRRAHQ
jgi:hypothetical protein